MKRFVLLAATAVILFAPALQATTPPPKLTGGESSIDALVDKFLRALDKKDERALHRLRVTEQEYRDIIVPGSVKPGEPPRDGVTEQTNQFFWSMLNQKSEDFGRAFIKGLGGRHYKRKELTFTKGTRQFAWYTAHGDVQLVLQDASGDRRELRTGTIAEIGGRYKFIGFNAK